MTGYAWAAIGMMLAGGTAYVISAMRDHHPGCFRRVIAYRAARALITAYLIILRARWAWRHRGRPPRNEGDPLDEQEREQLIAIRRGRRKIARPERSRT